VEVLVLVSSRFGQVNRANTWEGIQTFEDDIILTGTSSDVVIAATARIRLDGSPSGDTFIQEVAANQLLISVGSTGIINANGSNVWIPSTSRLLFDGSSAGDTFISESAANNLKFTSGGSEHLDLDATGIGVFGTAPAAQQTGVAVTAAAIHAALVTFGWITA